MLLRDLTAFMQDVAATHGPVTKACMWVGARPWVLVSDPVVARKMAYRSAARPLSAASFQHALVGEPRQVDSEAIFWVRGPAWRAARNAFEASILRSDRLAAHMPAVRRCTERFMARLAPYADGGTAVDMKEQYGVVALAVAGEIAYGVSFWPEDLGDAQQLRGGGLTAGTAASCAASSAAAAGAALMRACHECMECFELSHVSAYVLLQMLLPALQPLWLALAAALPDAAQRRHMAARQAVADVSRQLMQLWQQQQQQQQQQLQEQELEQELGPQVAGAGSSSNGSSRTCGGGKGAVGDAAGGGGGGCGRFQQVIAQGLSFILAAYDTTGTTLALTTFLLAAHPAVQDKLRAELVAGSGLLDSADGLAQLPYLDAVLRESQRLHPTVSTFAREATSDIALPEHGVTIPRHAACLGLGSFVVCCTYNMHRDPLLWRLPDKFMPERFLPETGGSLGPTDAGAYAPFGAGPRMCAGYKMATLVVKAVLSRLLLRYRVALHRGRQVLPLRLKTGITLEPADGVWVTLQPLAAPVEEAA
ncbi:hypothetical protein HYH02_006409 [Chlamydomonas schloesseri]|uniref:Cytochrome P450 n=1 Tax=Chlamydomonas schloesseri TaxID=2026947 RepID=A0A835WJN0_9CHLO|nr:hypothetical protein HYH02_006409 [Chlamydomonas schloesseri]|eukprot:KAG2448518.1 hypothetical protein HYH02_006409 [Chlamydomonas schloesseri]